MCGIIGYKGERDAARICQEALDRLSYRGYDSWGIATKNQTIKHVGEVVTGTLGLKDSDVAIGHTRWATHGGVTQENAHPHGGCGTRFEIVHNGIIENHEELKEKLDSKGSHRYTSETDSEVIAHYLEDWAKNLRDEGGYKRGMNDESYRVLKALKRFHEEAEGSYATTVLDRKTEKLYALKNKSPLLLAADETGHFLASDIYAVSKWSSQAHFMEDGEIAELDGKKAWIHRAEDMARKSPDYKEFEWTQGKQELGSHDHWMHKEIEEIPEALGRLVEKNCPQPSKELEKLAEKIDGAERVIFTASGTSYHASLLGVYYLQKAGVEAQALIASEFQNYERVNEDTLLVAVSQSGETRDVLDAIEYSRKEKAELASITNVPHSTIERRSDFNFNFEARQEICVAATKTFTNQLGTMMLLARELGADVQLDGVNQALNRIYETKKKAMIDAGKLKNEDDIYVLGTGITYPLSREIALKLKEISYKHAEGMMAGELKHGTLALIEEGTPVIALNEGDLDSSISEVESRGGNIINVEWNQLGRNAGPENFESEELYLFRTAMYGFWLTYFLGLYNGLPIDKPRNLAKSVTVE